MLKDNRITQEIICWRMVLILNPEIDPNKIHSLKKNYLNELILVFNPLSSQVEISSEDLDLDVIKRVSIRFEVQFAKEITALYYFHLYSDL